MRHQTAALSAARLALAREGLWRLLDLAEGFDRSWSFGATGLDERALFFLPVSARETLTETALALGFDAAGIEAFTAALPGADAIGMTLSKGGSVRLYLQYWDRMAARVSAGDLRPGLLYVGIKRWPGAEGRSDGYICLPLAPESEWRAELEQALSGFGCDAAASARFLAPLRPETGIWTRIDNPARKSWLMTLRRASPDPVALIEALTPQADRPGVAGLLAALQQGAPLHVAGGDDSGKGRFISFYVECDRHGMQSFLDDLMRAGQPAQLR